MIHQDVIGITQQETELYTPSQFQIAERYAKFFRLMNIKSEENGNENIDRDRDQLISYTDDITNYSGVGVFCYFSLLKCLIVLFILISLTSLVECYVFACFRYFDDPQHVGTFFNAFCFFSLGNIGMSEFYNGSLFLRNMYMSIIFNFIFIGFLLASHCFLQHAASTADKTFLSSADYTVVVGNLPKELKSAETIAMHFNKFGTVHSVLLNFDCKEVAKNQKELDHVVSEYHSLVNEHDHTATCITYYHLNHLQKEEQILNFPRVDVESSIGTSDTLRIWKIRRDRAYYMQRILDLLEKKQQMGNPIKASGLAFVTFEYARDATRTLKNYIDHTSINIFGDVGQNQPSNLKLNNNPLHVEAAYDPDGYNFDTVGHHLFGRVVTLYTVILLVVVALVVVLFFIDVEKDFVYTRYRRQSTPIESQNLDRADAPYIYFAAAQAATVLLVTAIVTGCTKKVRFFTQCPTRVATERAVLWRIWLWNSALGGAVYFYFFFLSFFLEAVMATGMHVMGIGMLSGGDGNELTDSQLWEFLGGEIVEFVKKRVFTVVMIFVINMLVTLTSESVQLWTRLWHVVCRFTASTFTQTMVNKFFHPPDWQHAEKFGHLTKTVTLCLVLQPFVPLLVPLTLVYLVLLFLADRRNLLRYFAAPERAHFAIVQEAHAALRWGFHLHLLEKVFVNAISAVYVLLAKGSGDLDVVGFMPVGVAGGTYVAYAITQLVLNLTNALSRPPLRTKAAYESSSRNHCGGEEGTYGIPYHRLEGMIDSYVDTHPMYQEDSAVINHGWEDPEEVFLDGYDTRPLDFMQYYSFWYRTRQYPVLYATGDSEDDGESSVAVVKHVRMPYKRIVPKKPPYLHTDVGDLFFKKNKDGKPSSLSSSPFSSLAISDSASHKSTTPAKVFPLDSTATATKRRSNGNSSDSSNVSSNSGSNGGSSNGDSSVGSGGGDGSRRGSAGEANRMSSVGGGRDDGSHHGGGGDGSSGSSTSGSGSGGKRLRNSVSMERLEENFNGVISVSPTAFADTEAIDPLTMAPGAVGGFNRFYVTKLVREALEYDSREAEEEEGVV